MNISPDKRRIRLQLTAELDATALSALIADLSDARAQMEPPIPMDLPQPGETGDLIPMQDEPSVIAAPLKGGRTRLWLRSHGLGWLAFNFTTTQTAALRDFFHANAPATNPTTSLFGGGSGNGTPPH
ncbi:MAG: hypothetical protein H3C27_15635 [Opitutaceae bacterium]|nr:hypothetical protein [Opitutaceae bacterium]